MTASASSDDGCVEPFLLRGEWTLNLPVIDTSDKQWSVTDELRGHSSFDGKGPAQP